MVNTFALRLYYTHSGKALMLIKRKYLLVMNITLIGISIVSQKKMKRTPFLDAL